MLDRKIPHIDDACLTSKHHSFIHRSQSLVISHWVFYNFLKFQKDWMKWVKQFKRITVLSHTYMAIPHSCTHRALKRAPLGTSGQTLMLLWLAGMASADVLSLKCWQPVFPVKWGKFEVPHGFVSKHHYVPQDGMLQNLRTALSRVGTQTQEWQRSDAETDRLTEKKQNKEGQTDTQSARETDSCWSGNSLCPPSLWLNVTGH